MLIHGILPIAAISGLVSQKHETALNQELGDQTT